MSQFPEIGAVILAAGRGRRLGAPKVMLKQSGVSCLAQIVSRLRQAGIERIVAVVRSEHHSWAVDKAGTIELAINPRPERGMLSSLYLGIRHLPHCQGVMVVAVDHPLVKTDTYRSLVRAFKEMPQAVVKPESRGRAGHPIVIPRQLAARVPTADIHGGLSALIRSSGMNQVRLKVDDDGVTCNINTPADRERLGGEVANERKHL